MTENLLCYYKLRNLKSHLSLLKLGEAKIFRCFLQDSFKKTKGGFYSIIQQKYERGKHFRSKIMIL